MGKTKEKAFRTFSGIKCERLSANTKQILHNAVIKSAMTYANLAWEFAAETYLMELQSLKNKVSAPLLTTQGAQSPVACGFPNPGVQDFVTKLYRKQENSYNSVEMKSRNTE
jgi:hypothetical protein